MFQVVGGRGDEAVEGVEEEEGVGGQLGPALQLAPPDLLAGEEGGGAVQPAPAHHRPHAVPAKRRNHSQLAVAILAWSHGQWAWAYGQ